VIEADGIPSRLVHFCPDALASLQLPRFCLDLMHMKLTGHFLRIHYLSHGVIATQATSVSHLPARLGIKRRAVQHNKTFLAGRERRNRCS